MMPVGPLMIEHRLIERMIKIMEQNVNAAAAPNEIDLALIEQGIDFLRTYADRCHHGKEEDYLFKDLTAKPLSAEHKKILDELMEEHTLARTVVKGLDLAREKALQGESKAYHEIADLVGKLAGLYPVHIEKEDKHFFIPIMSYFSPEEQETMLRQFAEFDQKMIHEKYGALVEKLEKAPLVTAQKISRSAEDMSSYICTVCGYVYDPALGDPVSGIPAGTTFADLPDDWVCPLCRSGKEMFQKVD